MIPEQLKMSKRKKQKNKKKGCVKRNKIRSKYNKHDRVTPSPSNWK